MGSYKQEGTWAQPGVVRGLVQGWATGSESAGKNWGGGDVGHSLQEKTRGLCIDEKKVKLVLNFLHAGCLIKVGKVVHERDF